MQLCIRLLVKLTMGYTYFAVLTNEIHSNVIHFNALKCAHLLVLTTKIFTVEITVALDNIDSVINRTCHTENKLRKLYWLKENRNIVEHPTRSIFLGSVTQWIHISQPNRIFITLSNSNQVCQCI